MSKDSDATTNARHIARETATLRRFRENRNFSDRGMSSALELPIPNAERAVIEAAKLHAYLLSRNHPIGRFKAAFFLALGYSPVNWRRLAEDLRSQHLSQDATVEERTLYGKKYAIRATLVGPSGGSAEVVSVWVVRAGEEFPRFVTAYPEG